MPDETSTSPERPGRRRLSADERRAQVLRATIDVVANEGFDAATTAAIADRAGVSKGLIWHHFGDKDALMKQAVVQTVREIRDAMIASVDPTAPVPELVRAFVRGAARLRGERPDDFRAMDRITSRLTNRDGSPAFSSADYEELYEGQGALFEKGQRDGYFRDFDTRVMAVTYQASVDAMQSYLDSHPDAAADAYAEALADLLLAAMAKTT